MKKADLRKGNYKLLNEELKKIEQTLNKGKQIDFKNLSVENQELLVEFNTLTSYSEKVLFWEKHFWTMGPYGIDTYTALNKLINILPENEQERILLNKERMALIAQDFKKSYLHKTVINKNITYEELKKEYLENLNHTHDKQKFIENEIFRINQESWEIENKRMLNIERHPDQEINGNLFLQVFQLTSNNDVEPDLSKIVYSKTELIDIIIGISSGKYLKFLKDELLKLKKTDNSQIHENLWIGDNVSLKLFRELLLTYGWISEIEEDEFINHFTNKSFSKSINWLKEQVTFMILFDRLEFGINQTYLIRWKEYNHPSPKELSRHFLFKGIEKSAEHLTKVRFLTSVAKNRKQIKREDEINSIVIKIRQQFKIDS